MMRSIYLIFLAFFSLTLSSCSHKEEKKDKTVLIAILARNKAHFLDQYLSSLKNLDYDKKLITVYINTNNNEDETEEILKKWVDENGSRYHQIIFDSHEVKDMPQVDLHEWPEGKMKVLATIRNKSLQKAKEYHCDYYFVADCDNYVKPLTLRYLIDKHKPIIAPMLRTIPRDEYSNFFLDVNERGEFKDHPKQVEIVNRKEIGTFKVPLVHCTYLVDSNYIDKLTYDDHSGHMEFIVFSRSARDNGIDQYICNEEDFGVSINGWRFASTLEEEQHSVKELGHVE